MPSSRKKTKEHIETVTIMIDVIINELIKRAERHDTSKLKTPEVEIFDEFTPKLAGCTYGSKEYKGFLEGMGPALDHHYAFNRHHPEHFIKGIDGMNIIDLIEMLCDWKAATLRHDNGDILRSINFNKKRFKMSDQLVSIFQNSTELFDKE